MSLRILILEDDDSRISWFLQKFNFHRVAISKTAQDAISLLSTNTFDLILLDHDLCNDHYSYVGVPLDANFEKFCQENLDETTGMAVAKWLNSNPDNHKDVQIIIHTMNTVAQKRMFDVLTLNSKTKERDLQGRRVEVVPFDYLKRKGFKING